MYKIGLVGHKSEDLKDLEITGRLIGYTIDLLSHQYGHDMILNICGERGTELIAGTYCMDNKIRYHLFLSQNPNTFNDASWYDEQQKLLISQFQNSFSVTICSSSDKKDIDSEKERDKLLVDDSIFLVVFWTGKKIGRTFDIIDYALLQNKIVLNGLNELKLLTKYDLKKK